MLRRRDTSWQAPGVMWASARKPSCFNSKMNSGWSNASRMFIGAAGRKSEGDTGFSLHLERLSLPVRSCSFDYRFLSGTRVAMSEMGRAFYYLLDLGFSSFGKKGLRRTGTLPIHSVSPVMNKTL